MFGLLSFGNIKTIVITAVIVALAYFYIDLYTDYKKEQKEAERLQYEVNNLTLELTISKGNVDELRAAIERSNESINAMALKNQNIEFELKKWQTAANKADKQSAKLRSLLNSKKDAATATETQCLELNRRISEMKYEDF